MNESNKPQANSTLGNIGKDDSEVVKLGRDSDEIDLARDKAN